MIITKEKILTDTAPSKQIKFLSIFALVGFLIPFIPFTKIGEINSDSIISFIVLFVLFGIPFGVLIGLMNIIKTNKMKNNILNGNMTILVDEIVGKSVVNSGRTSANDNSACQLTLKRYSEESKKNVCVKVSVYRKVKNGDKCTLVFVPSSKNPIISYAGNNYEISEELRDKIM